MQKKIIALAIAAALAAPVAASAAADVYGVVDLSIDMVNDGAATNSSSTNQLNSNYSRVGVKGSEAMGDNTFVWQMEGTVGMDAGATGTATTAVTNQSTSATMLFDRDTFVGVANASMGTLVLGQHDTPYKMATRSLDVFADSAADNRAMMAGHDVRLSNVIAYISPSFSGLTLAYASEFGAEKAGYTAGVKDKKGTAHSLAAMYSMDAIYGTFAYQTITAGSAATGDLGAGLAGLAAEDKTSAFKLGGGYKMDQIAVNAVYESTTMTPLGGTAVKHTNLYLAGKFGISATDAVKAAYTKHGAADTTGSTDDASQIAIGYDHDMSKATQVYALYTKVSTNSAVNVNPSALSFGIKHSF